MPVIELQTTINRPLFEVYQAATDFEEMVGYIPFIHHVDIIAGKPLRAGSMVTMQRQQMGFAHFGECRYGGSRAQ
jgi:uncharacterized membrane protein